MILAGPFLRYKRVEGQQWLGSVLIVVPSSVSGPTLTLSGASAPVRGTQLDAWNAAVFWRFDLSVPVSGDADTCVTYSFFVDGIDAPLADAQSTTNWSFWVAGASESNWRWAFTSCNGFSLGVSQQERDSMGGVGALWADLMRHHQQLPFHVQVGGGDQIYCDAVWQLDRLKEWLAVKGKENRSGAQWTVELETDISQFYFDTYVQHFADATMRGAMAQIPSVNMLDDHDIWDGTGSYPAYLESSTTFQNMKRIAFRFYLLFQQHTTPASAVSDGFIGADRGAYSIVTQLGPKTALMCLDARAERTREQVASPQTYDEIFAALLAMPASTKHVVVVTGVPLIYPRMAVAENLLDSVGSAKHAINKGFNKVSKVTHKTVAKLFGENAGIKYNDAVTDMKKALGKSGMMKSVLNHFGEPELADDLIDHWTNAAHDAERTQLILRLQQLSIAKHVRVTLIAGDVHCGGVGRFFAKSNDALADHHLMYQVISSAIVNVPPPKAVLTSLHKSATIITFNDETKEEMLNHFTEDVDGAKLSDKKLIGRRNWCKVTADPQSSDTLIFSLQVENKVWSEPSRAYPLSVPPMPAA